MIPDGLQSPAGSPRPPGPARDAVDAYERTGDLTALQRGIRLTRAALRQAVTAGDRAHAGEQVTLRVDLAVLLATYGNAVGDGDATREGLRLFAQAAAAAAGDAGATAAREATRALASWASARPAGRSRRAASPLGCGRCQPHGSGDPAASPPRLKITSVIAPAPGSRARFRLLRGHRLGAAVESGFPEQALAARPVTARACLSLTWFMSGPGDRPQDGAAGHSGFDLAVGGSGRSAGVGAG